MGHQSTEFLRSRALEGMEILRGSFGGATFPRHCHEEYVICLMTEGAERLKSGGRSEDVCSGNVLLIEPGEWHSNSGFEVCSYVTLYPSISLVNRFAEMLEAVAPATQRTGTQIFKERQDLMGAFRDLFKSVKGREDALEQETHLLRLVEALFSTPCRLKTHSRQSSRWPIAVCRVREKIDAEFATKLSLSEISATAGLSPCHLLRTFTDHVGITPHQYVIHRRVEEAKKLLRDGVTVGEVALRVGFADQSHLHRHFLRIAGVTPGRFGS